MNLAILSDLDTQERFYINENNLNQFFEHYENPDKLIILQVIKS